ncbi:MAG: serine/threonine-protein kinase, partial [Actinomycetota bacterium]|nr:serine/threonine-protein kinase [Actinomycetota bacterium]
RETSAGTDHVYLTDFGLVRPVSSETSATRTDQVFGSVAYMAPELIEGIPADGRADVYALACVVYECLTGSVPFERNNEVSTVWAHIHEDPPLLTDARPDLPGGLNDVVFKAMSKHPDDRYLTCGEFVGELELGLGRKLSKVKYSHARPLVARIPRRKAERDVWAPNFFPELSRVRAASRERFDWRKGVVLAVVVALLIAIQLGREGGIPHAVADVAGVANSVVDSAVDAVGDHEPPKADRTRADRTVAADGRRRPGRGEDGRIARSDRRKLKALLPVTDPTTSGAENGSRRGVVDGGGPGKIAWAKGSVSPDGTFTSTDLWVMNSDGSNEVPLTTTDDLEFWPSWSPDGAHIAYVLVVPPTVQDLWVMDADGSNKRDLGLCPGVGRCGKLAWSPDGRRVAYGQGTDLWVANLATGTRKLVVSGQLKEPNPAIGGRGSGPTWSPDGKRLAFMCGDDLCVVAANGGNPRVIGPGIENPAWSPDGALLVGEHWSDSENPDMVIHRLEDDRQYTLIDASRQPGALRFPSWAPDGEAIVYSDETSLFRVNRDGSGRVKLTSGERDLMPDWGPGSDE